MAFSIPSGVFTKYAEAADAMLASSGFGLSCTLVYTEKIENIDDSIPNFKRKKRMHLQNIAPNGGFKREDDRFRTVETTESITLRVYWDKKDFKKFGNIQAPDGSVMTIGQYSDMIKIQKASALLINTDRTGHKDWKFTKSSEPTIHGLDNNYFMCFWSRA